MTIGILSDVSTCRIPRNEINADLLDTDSGKHKHGRRKTVFKPYLPVIWVQRPFMTHIPSRNWKQMFSVEKCEEIGAGNKNVFFNYFSGSGCGFPGAPAHSIVGFSPEGEIGPGTVASYSCDRGFELLGPPRRICQDDGNWSPQGIPFCGMSIFITFFNSNIPSSFTSYWTLGGSMSYS